jgi:outer membrane lipoprotein SlyB
MKKILVGIMCLVLLTTAAMPASAQTTRNRNTRYTAQQRRAENSRRVNYERYERRNTDGSFIEEHRDKLTVAAGAGVGAAVGAATGGKKGALIGALIGAGGSAIYTYVLRDKETDEGYYRGNDGRYYRR